MPYEEDLKQVGAALQLAGAALARLAPSGYKPMRTPVPIGTNVGALLKSDTEGPEATSGPGKDTAKSNPVPSQPAQEDPKSLFWDPFAIIEQLGYKDRPSQLTYGTLKAMAWRTPVVHAVINTRVKQVASFCRPQHDRYQLGFRIKLRDTEKESTKVERLWMRDMETLITRTGVTKHPRGRENFEVFLQKITWDSLVYDQMCHPVATQIQTQFGSKSIEAIEVGDLVWTHQGKLRRVLETKSRKYTGKLISIRGRGQMLQATAEHPLLVVVDDKARFSRSVFTEWMEAGKVEPGMYLAYPRIKLSQEEVSTPWGSMTSDLAFALGLYVANGHQSRGALTYTLSAGSDYELGRLKSTFETLEYEVKITPYDCRQAVSLRVNSRGDFRLSRYFANCGCGATNKRVPKEIFKVSGEIKDAFLKGYLCGAGYFKSAGATYSTVSRQLFEGLRLLFADRGIYAAKMDILEGGVPGSGWNNQYGASISGQGYREWAERVGVFYVVPDRPCEPVLVRDEYFLIRVNQVASENVHDLPVYNFEVKEDHSYLAEGYVSHNCFEVVENRKGEPCEWFAVDASTIRLADTASAYLNEDLEDQIRYVQIYDGQVIAEFNQNELCFGVRNPRTDIRIFGYGVSELEMLIPTITSLLWGFEYNQRFFSQGSAPKGIINLKGTIPDKQLQQFRRHWYQMLTSVENAWRTPILSAEDLQYVNLQQSSRDMEFNAWLDFLIKIACSMYQMNPVEVNFQYGNVGQRQSLQESNNKEKITESRERGLRPLLRFIAEKINQYIVWPINESFEFAFVGLDAHTREQVADLNVKRVKTVMTVDELRAEDDLPPLPDGKGEAILDPTWMQFSQMKEGQAMSEEGGGFGESDMGEGEPEEGEEGQGGEGKPDFEKLLAQYEQGNEEEEEEQEKSLRNRVLVNLDL